MKASLTRKLEWKSCREHEDQVLATAEEDSEELQQVAAGRWDSFWGYDIVHGQGLLDKTYARLQIKQPSWPGLKELPNVSTYLSSVYCSNGLLKTSYSLGPQPLRKY